MQGFYDAASRDPEIDMTGYDATQQSTRPPVVDRRGHPDRRKKERRGSKGSKSVNLLQPILTEAEIAALLRGAR